LRQRIRCFDIEVTLPPHAQCEPESGYARAVTSWPFVRVQRCKVRELVALEGVHTGGPVPALLAVERGAAAVPHLEVDAVRRVGPHAVGAVLSHEQLPGRAVARIAAHQPVRAELVAVAGTADWVRGRLGHREVLARVVVAVGRDDLFDLLRIEAAQRLVAA